MDNDCVGFADEFKSFSKKTPSFSIFNYQFSIHANGAINEILLKERKL